jgi:hypothetical protein
METARRYYEVIKEIDTLICDLKLSLKHEPVESVELVREAQNRIHRLRLMPQIDLKPLALLTILKRIEEVMFRDVFYFFKKLTNEHRSRRVVCLGPPCQVGLRQYMQSVPDPL